MKIFAFVILHYNTIDDTRECVSSIRKFIEDGSYHIIIVDNGSPNGSGQILANDYQNDKDITVIFNNENLGFARGNNVGIKYAKENLKADFIILANSDTVLMDDSFISRVSNEYVNSGFAVLGPKEVIPTPPYVYKQEKSSLMTRKECFISMLKIIWSIILNFIGVDLWYQRNISKKNKRAYNFNPEIRQENLQLHGFFLVFSKRYFDEYDGLNDRTFLYREEELLLLRLSKKKLKSVYLPELQVFHKGGKATSSLYESDRRKRRYIYSHLLRSTYILYDELGK